MARLGGGTATKEPKAPKEPKASKAAKPVVVTRAKPSGGTFVGVDIGTHSIKAVELRGSGDKITVTSLAIGDTPAGLIQGGVVVDAKALGGAVKQLLSKNGIKGGRTVSAATGADAVVVRVIEVPRMTPAELAESMKWEVERHIPFAPGDVEMSYQGILDPKSPDDPDSPNMEVLLAVARRDMVATHLDTLTAAGFKPLAIDVEPLAVGRSLIDLSRGDLSSRNVVIVDMGHTSTDVSIFKNGILRFPRSLTIAGESFTRAIGDSLGLPYDAAEEEKKQNAVVLMDLLQTPGASGTDAFAGAEPSPFDFDFSDTSVPPAFNATTASSIPPAFDAMPAAPSGIPPAFDVVSPASVEIPSDRLPSVGIPTDRLPSEPIPSDRLPSPAAASGANVFDMPLGSTGVSDPNDPFALPAAPLAETAYDPFAAPTSQAAFDPYANSDTSPASASAAPSASPYDAPVDAPIAEPILSSVPVADDPMYRRQRDVFNALLPLLGEFTEEIQRSMDYFRSRYPADTIDQIILCGGSARIKNIDQYVQSALGIPTVVGSPFAGVNVTSKQISVDQLALMAPVFAVAVGLAARDAVLGAGR